MERLTLLGLPLDPVDMEEALKRIGGFLQEERTHQVVTLNPEIAVRAQEDEALRRAVLEAELVTPDGVGILWAVRRLHGLSLKERVTGIDLTLALLRRFPGVRVYLLGGKPGVAEGAAREVERLKLSLKALEGQPYRHLVVAFHFPPFGPGGEASPLLELAAGAHPQAIVYGHLHGADPAKLPQSYRGIPLHLVAADALRFRPKLVLEAD